MTLSALACLIALAGCASPPEAQANALDTVEDQGEAGPDIDPRNLPPATSLQATPTAGRAPMKVVFSLAGRDAEGASLSWSLDPGDGSGPQRGASLPVAVEHTYPAGRFQATFVASDGKEIATARVTIVAAAPTSSQAPVVVGGGGAGGESGGGGESGASDTAGDSTGTGTSATTSASSTTTAPPTSTSTTTTTQRGKDRTSSGTSTSAASTSTSTSSTSTSTSSTSTTSTSTNETTTSSTTTTTSSASTTTSDSTTSATTTTNEPPPNNAPSASLTAQQDSGTAPANVTYTVAASDPDGDLLAWTLDVQGDGTPDADGSGADGAWTFGTLFDQPGTYTALLTVTDGQETASDTVTITVS